MDNWISCRPRFPAMQQTCLSRDQRSSNQCSLQNRLKSQRRCVNKADYTWQPQHCTRRVTSHNQDLTSEDNINGFVIIPLQVDFNSSTIKRVWAITCSLLLFLLALGITTATVWSTWTRLSQHYSVKFRSNLAKQLITASPYSSKAAVASQQLSFHRAI